MPRRMILLAVAATGIAVLIGCLAAAQSGVPAAVWARNPAAWVVGMLIALLIARGRTLPPRAVAAIGIALLGATLLGAGMLGVTRWIMLGSIVVNVAMLVLPPTLVALAKSTWAPVALAAIAAMLAAQPDASQAVALAVAALPILIAGRAGAAVRGASGIVILGCAGLALARPDPLPSLPEVEGIMVLAWAVSPAMAITAALALGVAMLAPLALVRQAPVAAIALALLGAMTALAPIAGAFPVPLIGIGMSPIIGYWLGIGALAAASRRSEASR